MATIGLVLGAGGAVGHAWHAGVLDAIASGTGWDPRSADIAVGTSAGSVVSALLRAGIAPHDLFARATERQVSAEARRILAEAGMTGPPMTPAAPTRGRPGGPAALGLMARTALTPWRLRPGLLAAGALPRGRVDPGIDRSIGALHRRGWPDRPLWICAVRLDDGARVVFGRDEVEGTSVGEAVAASCAIPGYFQPVTIGGRDFVDGGVHSPTNADVVAHSGLDLVIVSSPMSLDSTALRRPSRDRVFRIGHRANLSREVAALRRRRVPVVTFQPGPEDLALMGGTAAAMDPKRRRPVAEQARRTVERRLESPHLQEALSPLG